MHYRLYQPGDFPRLYAIEEICFQPPLRFTQRYVRELVGRSNAFTWIAEDEGAMAGFSIVEIERDPHGIVAYIQTIEVLPEYRNRGVGNGLLGRVEDSARESDAFAIWLHVESTNAVAIRLYLAHGYEPKGRQDHYYARGRDADIYVKRLRPDA